MTGLLTGLRYFTYLLKNTVKCSKYFVAYFVRSFKPKKLLRNFTTLAAVQKISAQWTAAITFGIE